MAAATPTIIPDKSQAALIQFHKQCYSMLNQQWNLRGQMRLRDLAYNRENDWTQENWRAKLSNRYGDPTKFQNVIVPIVMPQVEAAVTYQSSVFLTGTPIFGFVAPPDQEDTALQYQAIVEENSTRGGWVQQFQIFFRDIFKYNLGAIEVSWDREVTEAVETDIGFMAGKEGKPKEVIWEGNKIKRWDLYNTFFDTRYKPTSLYKDGEFVGSTELMSRIHLKKFINELPDKMISNVKAAFESGMGTQGGSGTGGIESYYIPQINPGALMQLDPKRSTDWMSWAGMLERPPGQIEYKNLYEVTTMYARIIPSDFNLRVPSANTPQVWKFIVVNHQVLIYAERQTNAHGYLPVLFGQSNEDGLGFQTKSLADNAEPFQAIGSALVNSAMASRRRAISDRTLYDPSRVSAEHINSDNPSAKIPVRPAAYGKNVGEAVYAFPYRDDQSAVAFQELPQMMQMANSVNGQNQSKQGQFVKGNKTLHEYADVMNNANGRDQMTSMLLEAQVFTPLKQILKLNVMQYQAGVSIYSPSAKALVKIDPVELRKSQAVFKVTDGLTPTDKIISGDDFTTALQTIGSSPQIGAAYNIGPMFSYLMKTRNADITAFEKSAQQVAYEQAVGQWNQLAQAAIEKGIQFSTPQPVPQQFGYTPGMTADDGKKLTAQASQTAPASQGQASAQSSQPAP